MLRWSSGVSLSGVLLMLNLGEADDLDSGRQDVVFGDEFTGAGVPESSSSNVTPLTVASTTPPPKPLTRCRALSPIALSG